MQSKSTPRILISRLSAIGDALLTLPVACAIRDQLPDAYLAWIAEPAAASLLKGHSSIDELLVVPRGYLKSPRQLLAIRRRLRELRFDIAIDPQSLSKSSILGWLSGARLRIGFASPQGRELSLVLNNKRIQTSRDHVVDKQLDLLQPLGIVNPEVRFDVPRNAEAEGRIAMWIEDQSLSRFAVINPGAGWESKLWPTDRYAQVARHLASRSGLRTVVVWSGDRERQLAEQIVSQSNGNGIIGLSTTLPELASLLRRACLFVGSDTGPMHLAAVVGTPCVAIFGPTSPNRCGPYGNAHRAVQAYYQSGSTRERRTAKNHAMLAVDSNRVCQTCDEILSLHAQPQLKVAC